MAAVVAAAREAMVIPVKSFDIGTRLVLLVDFCASRSDASAFLSRRLCMNVTISVVNLQ